MVSLAPARPLDAGQRVQATSWTTTITRVLPGFALCVAVTLFSTALEAGEQRVFGRVWLESLVLAILVGAAIRTAWTPSTIWQAGINFSAKLLLEIAVVLLGASVSAATILSAGPGLLIGIAGIVVVAICASYGIGRALGLPHRMAMLVACGNSICGNSAIAAVAPVIGADGRDVAASIAFTAVLGVAVVLGLPFLGEALHLSGLQFGALAGLTVYAVPQVLAATMPAGAVAVQIGTLVKLVRVLMLGPVCLVLSVITARQRAKAGGLVAGGSSSAGAAADQPRPARLPLHKFVPWFILGFLALVAARSAGVIPAVALPPIAQVATVLTVISMAALGLCTNMRIVAKSGGRVTAAVTLSLAVLGIVSFALIRALHLG